MRRSRSARPAWRNWSGSVSADPVRVEHPRSVGEVVTAVRRARAEGLRVKPVGSGHSFSSVAAAPDVQVRLEGMTGVVSVDPASRRATLRAGTPLHAIPALLDPLGLAMTNLGDIDRQTLSGAVATGTHGTGLSYGGLATQVVGLSLVDGTGAVQTFGEHDPELAGAVISLGALGVVTELTLQCTDAFALALVEQTEPMGQVLETFVERCRTEDHLEFFWFPGTDVALTKTSTRLPADTQLSPLSRRRRLLEDELLANRVYALMCRLGARVPAVVPALNRVGAATVGGRRVTDRSDRVFVTSRSVRFHETEWAVPLDALAPVQQEIDAALRRRGWTPSFPLEFRAAAADDRWLSTGYGRQSGYVAAHVFHREDPGPYFRLVRDIALAHDGRPHWGKMHDLDHGALASRLPRMGDFVALRDRLDPDRLFANPYLDQVLPSSAHDVWPTTA